MIHELREYKLKPGKIDEYLDHVDTKVARLRGDRFGRLVGFFRAASGDLERVVHVWEYETLDARQDARVALTKNTGWMAEFIASVWPIIEYQRVTFLEVQEQAMPAAPGGAGGYLMRRCEAATGRALRAAQLLRETPLNGSFTAGRYVSISPDANTALDLLRIDAGSAASRCFEAADQLELALRGESARSVQIDLLRPVAISPLK